VSGRNILRFKPNKAVDAVVEMVGLQGEQPIGVMPFGDGWLVSTTQSVYKYNAGWEGERLIFNERIDQLAQFPDGRLIGAVNGGANLREMFVTPTTPALPSSLASYATAIDRSTTYLTNLAHSGQNNNFLLAHQIIGLGAAETFYKESNPTRAATVRSKMEQVGTLLRSRVRPDGGWGRNVGEGTDSMVTAMVGVALDHLNPSPDDPIVRNAVQLLLNRQLADGSWRSENGILPTNQAATSWVAIWLPIILHRLGGIDTDLTVTFGNNVTMSNPDRAPTSSTLNPDGTRTVMWRMVGVTATGQEINYDLSLANMAVNEVRPVSLDAHLTFRNDFTGGNVQAPIDVPRVTASAFLDLGVTTERTVYGANTLVNITGQVTNTDGGLAGGTVKFEIRAADNGLVTELGTLPFSGVGPGAVTSLLPTWNTGGTLSGNGYYVLATLFDGQGALVGTARSSFAIVSSENGTLASARISSDKQAYLPSDTAQVLSRATNLTQNQPLTGVTLTTTVLNTDGTVRFTRSELIPELTQSALRDFTYAVPIAFSPAGVYNASTVLRDAGGTVLASHATTFTVQSTAATGSGLTGTLLATPKQVPLGDAAVLSLGARNQGNGGLLGLPLTLRVLNPQGEAVLAEFPETVDLASGASHLASRSWAPAGPVGTTYVAVLSAMVGGVAITLAQDTFTVVQPPVQLAVSLTARKEARVLVLIGCRNEDDDHDDDHDHDHDCDHDDHENNRSYRSEQDEDDYEHHHGDSCGPRRTFLANYLTGLGVTHRIATSRLEFKRLLRSGQYNTYWISGGSEKLHHDLDKEVREAVWRGDALILDGLHDERNQRLDPVAGIKLKGKSRPGNEQVRLTGSIFTVGTLLPSKGRAVKLELTTAQAQAVFPHYYNKPAIATNQYGYGRAVTFAYDLVGTAMAHPSAALNDAVLAALGWIAPTPAAPVGGRNYTVLRTHIANVGLGTELKATFTPPSGATVLSTKPSTGNDANGRPVWTFLLDSGATKDLDVGLRLPSTTGTYTASTRIDSIRNGVTLPYGTFDLTLNVESADTIASRIATSLTALSIPSSGDRNDRDNAVYYIQSARNELAQQDYSDAIEKLLKASEWLMKISSVNVGAQRAEVARVLLEAQIRWALAQP
jgi:hypothetical protein